MTDKKWTVRTSDTKLPVAGYQPMCESSAKNLVSALSDIYPDGGPYEVVEWSIAYALAGQTRLFEVVDVMTVDETPCLVEARCDAEAAGLWALRYWTGEERMELDVAPFFTPELTGVPCVRS